MSKCLLSSTTLLVLLAFSGSAFAQGTEEKAKTVTITKKAYGKGDVISVSRTSTMQMKMTVTMPPQPNQPPAPPQVTDQKNEQEDERLIRVLEVKKGKITRVKLTFERKVQTMDLGPQMGGAKELPDSLDKRSFTIEKVGENWSINSSEGPVSEVDQNKIKRLTKTVFEDQGNSLAAAIPAKAMKVGDEVKASVAVIRELLDMRNDAFKFSECKLVLVGTKKINGKEHALFDLKYAAKNEGNGGGVGGMVMTVKGDGKLIVDVATGRQLSLSLKGVPKIDSNPNAQFSMHGDGEITVKEKIKLESKDEDEEKKEDDK